MRVLITGSRSWVDKPTLGSRLRLLPDDAEVLVGDAKGVDALVSYYSTYKRKWNTIRFPADWDLHGNKAGIVRNLEMLDKMPNLVLAFWDGKSRGTKFVIDAALKRRINCEVHFPSWDAGEQETG